MIVFISFQDLSDNRAWAHRVTAGFQLEAGYKLGAKPGSVQPLPFNVKKLNLFINSYLDKRIMMHNIFQKITAQASAG